MNVELTTYGKNALGQLTLNGNPPVIRKGKYKINLAHIADTSDEVLNHFLAPDNRNPYFKVVKEKPAASTSGAAVSAKK